MADRRVSLPQDDERSGRNFAFEAALGARIRAARVAVGMTQRALGDAVGIAYQKVQKYELGKDRIAISTLRNIAGALNIHPGSFFDGAMPRPANAACDVVVVQRSIELVQQLPDPRVARHVMALIREVGTGGLERREPDTEPPVSVIIEERAHRAPVKPPKAVIDPLVAMLQQAGTSDAGSLAKLLGQALAEAEKIFRQLP